MKPKVDVLICAHNEAENIAAVLQSLRAQSAGPGEFRVIVVDNNSTDDTAGIAAQHAGELDLTIVRETRTGLNYARNRGYLHAETEYVAHIDADSVAAERWIETLTDTIDDLEPDLLGGPYRPFYTDPKPEWFRDAYNSLDLGGEPRFLEPNEFLSGTNMVWRRDVVRQLGGFDSDIGLKARGLSRGDEIDLMMRARQEIPGLRIFYQPEILVYHRLREECLSIRYWLTRAFVEGRHRTRLPGGAARQGWLRSGGRSLKVLLRISASIPALLGVRDRRKYPYWQNYAFERIVPLVSECGYMLESIRPSSAESEES
jgi:glucosyl-dolichyl phosphate glucuronosyltransferase